MGFLDKAKKLAEQAQSKLDEVQKQVNTGGSSASRPSGPVVEYDKHGRPIPQQQTASPPHGDPLTGGPAAPPASTGPTPDPSAPPPPTERGWSAPAPPSPPPAPPVASGPPVTPGVPRTEPPSGPPAPVEGSVPPPAAPGVPAAPASPPAPAADEEDRNKPSYAPPKMTGGDPLAG
jgi:hypothetical protein